MEKEVFLIYYISYGLYTSELDQYIRLKATTSELDITYTKILKWWRMW
jgi:hypothetical protein